MSSTIAIRLVVRSLFIMAFTSTFVEAAGVAVAGVAMADGSVTTGAVAF